jgi:hypothetical protein
MRVRKVVQKRIRHEADGVNLAGDINAAFAANISEPGSQSHVRSSSRNRIVQRNGKTETITHSEFSDDSDQPKEVNE